MEVHACGNLKTMEKNMTRYQKYMQHIHDQATAKNIEQAVSLLLDDIVEHLTKLGVRPGSKLLNDIKTFDTYEYKPYTHFKTIADESGIKNL